MLAVALSRISRGIGDIERPHILEVRDREVVAGEQLELVQHSVDAWVQGSPVLGDGSGVVAGEDLALGPLGPPVAGGAIGLKDLPSGPHIAGLRLLQRPHGGKDPQGLRVEGLAGPLSDAVVVNGGVGERRGALVETGPGVERIAGEAATPLGRPGYVLDHCVTSVHASSVVLPLLAPSKQQEIRRTRPLPMPT